MIVIVTLLMIFITVVNLYSQPVTTPIEWTGLDSLFKYARHHNGIERNENPAPPYLDNKHEKTLGKLIDDPRVKFSTYFGGNGYDCSFGLCVDSKDYIYICGYTGSSDLPTPDEAFQKSKSGGHDAFVAKFTQEGQPVWITYYGGSGTDVALDMVCDSEDNLIICGKTNSNNLPDVSNSFNGDVDAFILKMNEDGELLWSQYIGGERFDSAEGIDLFSNDDFIITGYTGSMNFPVTEDAFQKANHFWWVDGDNYATDTDAFITKYDSDGNLTYSTFLGGKGYTIAHAVAVDNNNNYSIVGYIYDCWDFPVSENAFQKDTSGKEDGFVAIFDNKHTRSVVSLLAGNALDKVFSEDFIITENAFQKEIRKDGEWISDSFLTKISKNGVLLYSSYWGAESADLAYDISISNNSIWITGATSSKNIQTSETALPNFYPDDEQPNIYLLQMDLNGNPLWISYYSGGQNDFAYNITSHNSKMIFTGETRSIRFPVTGNPFEEYMLEEYMGFLVSVDVSTIGVKEESLQGSYCIQPNPARDYIEIKVEDHRVNPMVQDGGIEIFDVLGKSLLRNTLSSLHDTTLLLEGNKRLDVSHLQPGIYFVRVGDEFLKFIKI